MADVKERYYAERARKVITSLQRKYISAYYVPNRQEALTTIVGLIPAGAKVAFGDSMTLEAVGVVKELRGRKQNEITYPMEADENGNYLIPDREQRWSVQVQAATSDIFLTGSNAITLDGKIVNVDGLGNRVAPLIFGPKKVIVVVGANKIVRNVDEALERIKNVAAPMNAMRHYMEHHRPELADLPCVRTGSCQECANDFRICHITVIIDGLSLKNKGRTNVVIIGEELGL